MTAERVLAADDAPVLHPVGALDDERQRRAGDGIRGVVANERGEIDGLARSIDAALGIQEHVERARRRPAGDAAVGQVEAGAGQVDEGEVRVRHRRGQHARRQAAGAARHAGAEVRHAARVGDRLAEQFVVARDQLHGDAFERLRRFQRAGEDVQSVVAEQSRDADVGDDEPLRGERLPVLLLAVRGLRRHHVDAGPALGQCVVDGEDRGHLVVERALHRHGAGPHLHAGVLGESFGVPLVELAQERPVADRAGQAALADAIERDLDLGGVDGDGGNTLGADARQHEIVAREAHRGAAVAHVDVENGCFLQRLVDDGGDAGAHGDLIALAMRDAIDAELFARRGDRRRGLSVERHIGREVEPPGFQFLGELDADPRRGRVGVDRVVDDAEAVLLV